MEEIFGRYFNFALCIAYYFTYHCFHLILCIAYYFAYQIAY